MKNGQDDNGNGTHGEQKKRHNANGNGTHGKQNKRLKG